MMPVTQTTPPQATTSPRLMIVDSATLYYRAFYALPETMTAPDGTAHNAIRGFCEFLNRLVTTYRPAGLICAWDSDWRPHFRVQAWPAYKAHRIAEDGTEAEPDTLSPQVEGLAEILDAMGVCRLGHDDFEADDVIATAAAFTQSLGYTGADIVTSDRDLLQCVDDAADVVLLSIAKGISNIERLDDGAIMVKYGVRADQYRDYATMRGDASDGLPGVPGIGAKTAASLLAEYSNLDGIRRAAADPTSPMKPAVRKRLLEAEPTLDALVHVSTAVVNVPLGEVWPDLPLQVHDTEELRRCSERWGVVHAVRSLTANLQLTGTPVQ
ncbi:MAG: flap endonuclease [Actinobacteria bacterium]|nr:flap endonuclease [Actinomycetota bacterium]